MNNTAYENSKTKSLQLDTKKTAMVENSMHYENNAIDFPHEFGYITLMHSDLFNLMRKLPANAFKLYLYLFTQKEGAKWELHRDKICSEIGISPQEYRTAIAKLVELGIIDFESAKFNGIAPLNGEEIFNRIDKNRSPVEIADEIAEPEVVKISPKIREICERWKKGAVIAKKETEN